jgi:hypothetical protein
MSLETFFFFPLVKQERIKQNIFFSRQYCSGSSSTFAVKYDAERERKKEHINIGGFTSIFFLYFHRRYIQVC